MALRLRDSVRKHLIFPWLFVEVDFEVQTKC